MKYSVRGLIGSDVKSVTWENGGLSGDGDTLQRVLDQAAIEEGNLIGPCAGPYTDSNHLADPLSAYFLMEKVFDQVVSVTGDALTWPVEEVT